jgi:hypothetical protein
MSELLEPMFFTFDASQSSVRVLPRQSICVGIRMDYLENVFVLRKIHQIARRYAQIFQKSRVKRSSRIFLEIAEIITEIPVTANPKVQKI